MNESSDTPRSAEPGRRLPVLERLGPQDLMMLWPDDLGWPEEIGALAILDGTGLLDPDGRFRVEAVREVIGSRLPQVPRFRQLLHTPRRGLGLPLWVDSAELRRGQMSTASWPAGRRPAPPSGYTYLVGAEKPTRSGPSAPARRCPGEARCM
ncbi:wax ester/triacylglycerol synthase domain-containing protein [Streptomyces sp. NL15-2K]|uniref:wax ester/triacylglycerol synthase domain-containing protein n=1 Tax=Streptomyces sp. NL15-2K TaxID=376149 RepID=UPI000F589C8F